MKIKLSDLVIAQTALQNLAQAKSSARMSFTLSLVLNESSKHMEPYSIARLKLLKELGVQDKTDSNLWFIPLHRKAEFDAEHADLVDVDIVLTGIGKIKASVIAEEGIKLSGQDAYTLRWLIKSDVETMFEPDDDKPETPPAKG